MAKIAADYGRHGFENPLEQLFLKALFHVQN